MQIGRLIYKVTHHQEASKTVQIGRFISFSGLVSAHKLLPEKTHVQLVNAKHVAELGPYCTE